MGTIGELAARTPLVVACDLTKVYVLGDTELRALDGVSLTVQPGESSWRDHGRVRIGQ